MLTLEPEKKIKPQTWLSSPQAELEPWRGPVMIPLAELFRELWFNA